MNKISIFCLLSIFFVVAPAFPLSYQFDFDQDMTWDTYRILPPGSQVTVSVWLDGYSCMPDNKLLGSELYFYYDNSTMNVTEGVPADLN